MSIDLYYLEDCNRVRPNWMPEDGVASSFLEFLILLNTPLGYVWIAVCALFLWKRNAFAGAIMTLCSLALLANWVAMYELDDDLYLGVLGGCVGSLSVTISALIAGSLLGMAVVAARLFQR
ncbi:hypothetical protein [Gymnodinialimonas hymeniacidonis]|uniref:hypothetical protein n=1 Tax=Gymnodinialimonas hymeniacidonis TaxID=3126508 RepID=UPI0034C6A820